MRDASHPGISRFSPAGPLTVVLLACLMSFAACTSTDDGSGDGRGESKRFVRFMAYNIEDVRTADVKRSDHPRLIKAAARIQSLRPDVLLINELSYDEPGGPDVGENDEPGQNARRFAETYLARAQSDSLEPLSYQAVMLPVNTGRASGLDLNNDGRVVTEMPQVPGSPADGSVAPQNEAGRAYGGDAWGFGTFPGQYGMALFVRDDLEVLRDSIRTFRLLPWSSMPNPSVPVDSVTGEPYYSDAAWEQLRVSSKSHWDIPIRLPDGRMVHVLASHPTPPTLDGAADRNGRRNHDEIQLWADYVSGVDYSRADYIVDDSSRAGGLPEDAAFVIMGDQNADPDEGDSYGTPIVDLIALDRVQDPAPTAMERGEDAFPDLDPDDTARWGLRVDYVLPSANLTVDDSGVWRPTAEEEAASDLAVSDHFPVWVNVRTEPRASGVE